MNKKHGWDFSGYRQISGFSKEASKIAFWCEFSLFRIQTLTQSHPWTSMVGLQQFRKNYSMVQDVRITVPSGECCNWSNLKSMQIFVCICLGLWVDGSCFEIFFVVAYIIGFPSPLLWPVASVIWQQDCLYAALQALDDWQSSTPFHSHHLIKKIK